MLRALDLSAEEKAARSLPELPDAKNQQCTSPTSTKTVLKTTRILTRCVKSRRKKVLLWFRFVLLLKQTLPKLDDEERDEFMQELGLEEPGLNRVIRAGYKLLNLQTYFTAGVKEVRAWTIPVGATAPQAAGKIHTDFEKGFIRAQTISFEDFITYKGEQGAKEAGKMRAEGKDYIVKDGDVMNFLFNV